MCSSWAACSSSAPTSSPRRSRASRARGSCPTSSARTSRVSPWSSPSWSWWSLTSSLPSRLRSWTCLASSLQPGREGVRLSCNICSWFDDYFLVWTSFCVTQSDLMWLRLANSSSWLQSMVDNPCGSNSCSSWVHPHIHGRLKFLIFVVGSISSFSWEAQIPHNYGGRLVTLSEEKEHWNLKFKLNLQDQQITAVIVNRKENLLKKGGGYHLDLLVVAIGIVVNSFLGIPW